MYEERFDYSLIPLQMMDEIKEYVNYGNKPCRFLQYVLLNDLFGAIGASDDYNIKIIPTYCAYIYNETPDECHGSIEKVRKWIKDKQCKKS